MLNGMMITAQRLDVTLGHAAPVRLHQAGFSSKAIQNFKNIWLGLPMTMLSYLSLTLLPIRWCIATEAVFDSRIVFVIGSSGTGKTALATKIAAYFKEHGISDRMVLAAAGPGISASEDIKSTPDYLTCAPHSLASVKCQPPCRN